MKTYAIGLLQQDGTMDIDPRDFKARNERELLLLIMACEVVGEIDIMEYIDSVPCCDDDPWTYEDELRERNMLN